MKEMLKIGEELLQLNITERFENGDSLKQMFDEYSSCGTGDAIKMFLQAEKEHHPNYTDDELIISARLAKISANVFFANIMSRTSRLLKKEKDRKQLADIFRSIANNLDSIKGDITNE